MSALRTTTVEERRVEVVQVIKEEEEEEEEEEDGDLTVKSRRTLPPNYSTSEEGREGQPRSE